MKPKKLTLFILLVWIPSLVAGLIFSMFLCYGVLSPPADPEVIAMIADRIGVEPDWDAISNYIEHDAIKPGMTREEVGNVLDKIGPWETNITYSQDITEDFDIAQEKSYGEIVYFIERNTSKTVGEWSFFYKYGKLDHFNFCDRY